MNWITTIIKAAWPLLSTLFSWMVNGAIKSDQRARQAELERDELLKSDALQTQREKEHVQIIEEITSIPLSPNRINELLSIDTSQNSPAYRSKGKKI